MTGPPWYEMPLVVDEVKAASFVEWMCFPDPSSGPFS